MRRRRRPRCGACGPRRGPRSRERRRGRRGSRGARPSGWPASSRSSSTTGVWPSSEVSSSGPSTRAYLGLVDELGLTVIPSDVAYSGADGWDLARGAEPRARSARVRRPRRRRLRAGRGRVRRDRRDRRPRGPVVAPRRGGSRCDLGRCVASLRRRETQRRPSSRALCTRARRRARSRPPACSPTPARRRRPGTGASTTSRIWESLRVAEGSATVATRMADELGRSDPLRTRSSRRSTHRIPAPCHRRHGRDRRCRGGRLRSSGRPAAQRRAARCRRRAAALTASATARAGRETRRRVRPRRLGRRRGQWARPRRRRDLLDLAAGRSWDPVRASFHPSASTVSLRRPTRIETSSSATRSCVSSARWRRAGSRRGTAGGGHDPFTLGYITAWRPGDVTTVGPRHGTHAPPFYVCGSDQWVAGYMEGAVRTGRGAAAAALGERLSRHRRGSRAVRRGTRARSRSR